MSNRAMVPALKRWNAAVDLAAALALFILAGAALAWGAGRLPPELRMPVVVVAQGLAALGIVGGLLAWRGRTWTDVGLGRIRARDLPRGLLALAGCLGANIVLVAALGVASPETVEGHSERLGILSRELMGGMVLPVLAAVLGFVGFYEEVFARGFLLSRSRSLLGGAWAPVLVSSALFGIGHLYQGWMGVAQTTLVGVVLALFTLRWGTLWPAIIAHALLDIASVAALSGMTVGGSNL